MFKIFFVILFFNILHSSNKEMHYSIKQIASSKVEVSLEYDPKLYGKKLYIPEFVKILEKQEIKKGLLNSKVKIKYIIKAKKNWKFDGGYNPLIEKDFFHLEGENFFVRPIGTLAKKVDLLIDWDPELTVANSFGIEKNTQRFTASYLDLNRSVFIGGKNLKMERVESNGNAVYFLDLTRQKKLTKNKPTLLKILEKENAMFESHSGEYLVALVDDGGRGGGRSFVNACCLYLPKGQMQIDIPWLFAHEHFHKFNGIRLHPQYSRENLTWFVEGFTEFYANRINHYAGIYDDKTYYSNVAKTRKEYERSKVRGQSYKKIVENRNYHSASNRYLYVKGHLFAHYLEQKIKEQSEGAFCLDHFMIELYKKHYPESQNLSFRKIEEVYAQFDTTSLKKHFEDFMFSKELILDETLV